MQNPPPVQAGKSSTGLEENLAALLSYVFGWLSGLIFLLIEKDSRLVRFHAMQSIMLNVLAVVIGIVLWILMFIFLLLATQLPGFLGTIIGLLATLLWIAFSIGLLIAWVMCLIKAYQGQFFKLPVIGNLAEKFVNK
jgi:uncharacterized membrane protein